MIKKRFMDEDIEHEEKKLNPNNSHYYPEKNKNKVYNPKNNTIYFYIIIIVILFIIYHLFFPSIHEITNKSSNQESPISNSSKIKNINNLLII